MRQIFFMLILSIASAPGFGDELIESYISRLDANDHFNSSGGRLTSPALIIRQDRANFHKFGQADMEDEGDSFFQNVRNRELLQNFLERGHTAREAYRAIVNRQPLVRVNIYRARSGNYTNVLVLSE